MADQWIKVAAPATTSNIGAGFDVFGLALKEPFDIIEARKIDSGIVISEISGPGSDSIPTDPLKNSVAIAAKAVLDKCNANFGIELKIKKGIRPGSGIGSSGASAGGGAFVANILCGEMLSKQEVVLCAAHAEDVLGCSTSEVLGNKIGKSESTFKIDCNLHNVGFFLTNGMKKEKLYMKQERHN